MHPGESVRLLSVTFPYALTFKTKQFKGNKCCVLCGTRITVAISLSDIDLSNVWYM